MNAIWQMWAKALSDELCDKIITECEYYQPIEAQIGDVGSKVQDTYRKSIVRWVNKDDENSRFIHDLLWKYGNIANRNAFGFNITSLYEIQYTIYEGSNNGFYKMHHDTFWANNTTFDRKISLTVQLTDPKDYDGGEFMFDQEYQQPDAQQLKQRGTVLAFASPIKHHVKPVTRGTRKCLVAWIEGPKWR